MLGEPREWILEGSTLRFEPPDVFWGHFHGMLSLEDAKAAVAIYRKMGISEARPFFFVAEPGRSARLDPEAARYLSENLPSSWMRANIYIGARLLHRALAKGLALASRLTPLADDRALEKIHHVATEAEARALLVRLRAAGR